MELTKELAIAMLAGAKAIREKLSREGGSTYVLDPFNERGMKAEIIYKDAEQMLHDAAYDVLFPEPPKSE